MRKAILFFIPTIFCFLGWRSAFSQNQDTLVVYEYIYQADTIWIESQQKEEIINDWLLPENLKIFFVPDPFEKKIELNTLFEAGSATISKKPINISESQNHDAMKRVLILGFVLAGSNGSSHAQTAHEKNWSFFVHASYTSQMHSYPNIVNNPDIQVWTDEGQRPPLSEEEYGTYLEEFLWTPGFGISYNHKLNNWLAIVSKSSYLQRGCRKEIFGGQYIVKIPEMNAIRVVKTNERFLRNRFHYLSCDLVLKASLFRSSRTQPYFFSGIRGDLLLFNKLAFDIDNVNREQSGYTGFNRWNYGIVNGIGVDFNKQWYMQIDMNNDLGYLVKNQVLKVRNVAFSATVGTYF
jgi:hypothetical protein